MSKDISTMFTKHKSTNEGRKGYAFWKTEKITDISPKQYGIFIQKKRRNKNYE